MNFYYNIWVDAIVKIRNNPSRKDDWKWVVQIFMATPMCFNLMFLLTIVERHILGFTFYQIEINLFPGEFLNVLLSAIILFFLPPLVINYWLVFRNEKYIDLIEKYGSENGNYFFPYFLTSLLLPIAILWIGVLLI